MKFEEITKEEYDKYFKQSKYNHFLQSSAWAETCIIRKQEAHYVALKDEKGNIQAATALLKRNMPLGLCYFYAPRGFLIDFTNKDILNEFTKQLKIFIKKHNAIQLDVDPGISYQEIDENASPINGGKNNYEIFDNIIKAGYKHKGFTKLFGMNQPRYTFRINTQRPMEEIEKDINKTFMKTVKRSYNYDLEVSYNYDNHTFYNLMRDIANRNNFNGNSEKFYEIFEKNFKENDNVLYISIKIYPVKLLEKANNELKELEEKLKTSNDKHKADIENQINRTNKDIEMFSNYKEYKDGIDSLTLICPKTNHAMWTLYIGNNDLAMYTFAVNRAYYEAIKYAQEQNFEFLDLYGTMGEPNTKEKNYAAIHEYKRKMGGEYTEFLGEFALVNKPILYYIVPKLTKLYRKIRNKLKK